MKRTKTLVIALWAVFVNQVAFSQKGTEEQLIKDANTYFKTGEYLKAFPLYSQLVSLYPNHADYNYKFGACAIYSDADKTKAVRFLTIAVAKGAEDDMAWYYLGKAYHLNYQFKDAIKAYETFIRNADPKVAEKTDAQREIETCIYGSNLLANIKDVSVISKTESDKANFFRYFNLEDIGGKILTVPDELKSKIDMKSKEPGVIHYPGNGTTIYFSSFGKDGSTGKDIYKAQVLPDGKFSTPTKLEGDVNTKYDEDFCFMHSDGKTLYFSSKGHNSMGGYDIFKSVYDAKDQKFGPAINLDFAINTPDDDIFYIADSLNKKAYFASGRASDLNHLNVYNVLVESTPLQVVYLKGSFASEINPDQKKAGIKIYEDGTGRMVCDAISGNSTGAYTMFVPKSGEYTFKVVTENSPMVHEVKVNVPVFEKPVAIRQEMKLVSEGGKDKLLVTNYFETPLDEDLSALAAEMLRKKSNLDVNLQTDSQATASNNTSNKSSGNSGGELTTFEKTIQNATLAAGFANGTQLTDVVVGMQKEVEQIRKFVAESDTKRDNSIAYAAKKQKEADAAISEAEAIRRDLGTISNDEDIKKLRKSVELTDKAEQLQMEARAAMNGAESINQYKTSESERATALSEQVETIKKAETSNNYDAAVAALTQEKDRQTAMRDGNGGSPSAELIAKAKARESEQMREEQKLSAFRDREKEANSDFKAAEQKLGAAKKEKDKQLARDEMANAKSELDNVRVQIVSQSAKVEKAGNDAKLAHANAAFFNKASDDTNVGLAANEQIKINDVEKTKLSMRIDELHNRVAALEITDPQMLAMITDDSMNESTATTSNTAVNSGTPASKVQTGSSSPADNTVADVASTTAGTNKTGTNSNTNTPATGNDVRSSAEPITPMGVETAANIRSRNETMLATLAVNPAHAAAVRMYTSQYLLETENAIRLIKEKQNTGAYTEADTKAVAEFEALAVELRKDLQSSSANAISPDADVLRSVYASYVDDYDTKIQEIVNSPGSEMDRTIKMMEFKQVAMRKLVTARIQNVNAASEQPENAKVDEFAANDQLLEAAINSLYNETSDVNQYKAAFETDNKSIIESDAMFNVKLDSQIDVTENYISALTLMEESKTKEMATTIDPAKIASIEQQLLAIEEEKKAADIKLASYNHDLQLTASASEPKGSATENGTSVTASGTNTTLEDAMESSLASDKGNSISAAPEKSPIEEDVVVIQKLFKNNEEAESIFAFESGMFEEIVAQHQNEETKLKNREKIQEINDQIFLLEAEMENEPNPSKLRKLDYKAEQLYLKRSLIEIDNNPAIAKMTKAEFDEEMAKTTEMVAANQDKIDSKIMIRDEVRSLLREADVNMRNGDEIRAKSPSIQDDIERADYCRRAFAKESLAIEQLRQAQAICNNIDMLVEYSDQDLAMLRTGTIPSDKMAKAIAQDAGVDAADISVTETESDVAANTTTTAETGLTDSSEKTLTAADSSAQSDMSMNMTSEAGNVPSSGASTIDVAMKTTETETGTTNPTFNFSTTGNGEVVTDHKVVVADGSGVVNMNIKAEEPTAKTATVNSNLMVDESVEFDAPAPGVSTPLNTSSTSVSSTTTTASPERTAANTVSAPAADSRTASEPAAVTPSNAAKSPEAKAKSASSANAADYYYSMPEVVTSDLFVRTPRAVYSETKPIPVNAEMPKGVYYKVQVGAFRNDIPQNLYDEFAPVSGEKLSSGITRYTAGFFTQFEGADKVKKEIRNIGYGDAFVVAFRDGKRIPLYEAMAKTDGADFVAAIEKEYIYGDKGEAPKPAASSSKTASASSTPSATAAKVNGDYNKSVPNAAPATAVETVTGLFFTVQVGVYSKPVTAKGMYNITPLNSELTETKKIRYTSGRYTSLMAAVEKRSEAKGLGIKDAFITAYYNGKRISLSEADRLLKENGPGILMK